MTEMRFKPIKHINTVIGVRDTMSDVDYDDWESISDLLNQLDKNSLDYLIELFALRKRVNVQGKTIDDLKELLNTKNFEIMELKHTVKVQDTLLKRIDKLEERLDAIGKGLED